VTQVFESDKFDSNRVIMQYKLCAVSWHMSTQMGMQTHGQSLTVLKWLGVTLLTCMTRNYEAFVEVSVQCMQCILNRQYVAYIT
jgi:hypothetical protein